MPCTAATTGKEAQGAKDVYDREGPTGVLRR